MGYLLQVIRPGLESGDVFEAPRQRPSLDPVFVGEVTAW